MGSTGLRRHSGRGRHALGLGTALVMLWFAQANPTMANSPGPAVKEHRVDGLAAPVEILVDRWGVPHIYAADEDDLYFAQGFNAARDRLWQIDLWRRRGLGQLAEVFGADYVAQDRAARLLLYRGSLRDEWLAYGANAKRIATRFVAGINAYIAATASRPELLPIEFRALGYLPARWQAEDIVRIRSHGLWRNLTNEVARAKVVCRDGVAADAVRKQLAPSWQPQLPEGLDPCVVTDAVLADYQLGTAEMTFMGGRPLAVVADPQEHAGTGSNNWVVAPARTTTGRPLLANDPHRTQRVPSLRYVAHLSAPGIDVVGAGEPALPGISIGHNGRVAFGLTIFALDHEDLYVYEADPTGADRYRYRGAREAVQVVREQIAVRDGPPVEVELRFTRHGPVLHRDSNGRMFALRAAWLLPGMAPYFGSIEYMRARNWREFRAALDRWGGPGENQVYADTDGHIGYRAAGYFPRRDNFDGLLPVPGDGRYEWNDAFDGDTLPERFDPPAGYIATANALTLPADYPIAAQRVGFEWTAPWRQQRIDAVLAATPRLSVDAAVALQRDYHSVPAQRLLQALKRSSAGASEERAASAEERAALDLLLGWNGELARDSSAAALFAVWWQRHLPPAVARALAPQAALVTRADSEVVIAYFAGVLDETKRSLLRTTLAAAWRETAQLLGPQPTTWRWGSLHQIVFRHPLLDSLTGDAKAAAQLPRHERGGNGDTPNATTHNETDFEVRSGASFRMVLDVGAWDNARMTNAPGQSGDPRSPHYGDLLAGWANDESFPMLYSRAAVEAATRQRILLQPR